VLVGCGVLVAGVGAVDVGVAVAGCVGDGATVLVAVGVCVGTGLAVLVGDGIAIGASTRTYPAVRLISGFPNASSS